MKRTLSGHAVIGIAYRLGWRKPRPVYNSFGAGRPRAWTHPWHGTITAKNPVLGQPPWTHRDASGAIRGTYPRLTAALVAIHGEEAVYAERS